MYRTWTSTVLLGDHRSGGRVAIDKSAGDECSHLQLASREHLRTILVPGVPAGPVVASRANDTFGYRFLESWGRADSVDKVVDRTRIRLNCPVA